MADVTVPKAQTFHYSPPDSFESSKTIVTLAKSDVMRASVQVIREGGENNLHHHTHSDGIWFVLGGRVRFYTTNDDVIGEFGSGEGVLVRRGYPYWFESVDEAPLEILHVAALDFVVTSDRTFTDDRENHTELKQSFSEATVVAADRPA